MRWGGCCGHLNVLCNWIDRQSYHRKGRDVDMSGIFGYGYFEFLDKLDGIADEESKSAILVLAILEAIFRKEMYTYLW
jgi:hypothetical protein